MTVKSRIPLERLPFTDIKLLRELAPWNTVNRFLPDVVQRAPKGEKLRTQTPRSMLSLSNFLAENPKRTAGLLFLTIFLFFSGVLCLRQVTRTENLVESDGRGYFAHLPSVFVDGDLDSENNLQRLGYHEPNHWTIGTAVSWGPAYLVGHAVSIVLENWGQRPATLGDGFPEQLACCLATIAYGAAAVSLTFLLLCRWFEPLPSLAATVGLFGTTNLWYYSLCEPYMSHGVSTFWVTVILFLGLTDTPLTPRTAALLGLATGLAALTRPQEGLALVAVILWHLLRGHQGRWRTVGLLFMSGVLSLCLFSLQLHLWQKQTAPSASSVGLVDSPEQKRAEDILHVVPGGAHNWFTPKWAWALTNEANGLWLWHPVNLIALVGLLMLVQPQTRLALSLLGGYLALLYMVAAWTGQGQSYGGRMMCGSFALLAPGLGYLFTKYPKTLVLLLLPATVGNLWLALRYRQILSEGERVTSLWQTLGF